MTARLTTIGFDADDTLWENEQFFRMTQERFAALLSDYTEPADLLDRLEQAELRNHGHYGFGIKGFVLSMIETAIDVTGQRVPASVIAELISAGQEMLRHPVALLPGVGETLRALAGQYRIVLITKGDLLDQERKLAQSGLGDLFDAVEILSDKHPAHYTRIFARHGTGATEAMMVGNSMRSDVLPALEAGAWGVHVPHTITWAREHAEPPATHRRFFSIDTLAALPDLLKAMQE